MNGLRVHVRSRSAGYDFAWWPEAPAGGPPSGPVARQADVLVGEEERSALRSAIDLAAQSIGRLPGAAPGEEGLRRLGALVHGRLLPPTLATTLAQLPAGAAITWATDEADMPWELAYDGSHFLSLRHPLTRVLLTRETVRSLPGEASRPTAVLLIANPNGNLPNADVEAEALLEAYDAAGGVRCDLLARDQASATRVLEALAAGTHAVIHFAGHARPGALRLADGWLSADIIAEVLRGAPMIVLNACDSARSPQMGRATAREGSGGPGSDDSLDVDPAVARPTFGAPSGLISALLRGGAAGVVGQMWPVFDARAGHFGPLLHRRLLAGESMAVAVQQARSTARSLAPGDVAWAAPVLWADGGLRPIPPRPRSQPGSVLVARRSEAVPGGAPPVTVLREALSTAVGAIRQRGGRVLSRDERGLCAVFGVPRTLEDDAARALAASLVVREALSPLAVGVGVSSGDLEVDEGRGDDAGPLVYGPAVSHARTLAAVAARMQRGTILVGANAARLAGSGFHLSPIAGEPELSASDRVLLARRGPASGDDPLGPTEGRSAELGTLAVHWGAARAGRGCVVGIVGEAGVGKSHLLSAFRQSLSGVVHCWYKAQPAAGGDAPYALIGRLLRELLDLAATAGLAAEDRDGPIGSKQLDGPSVADDSVALALTAALPSLEASARLHALVAEVCGARGVGATPSEPDEARGLLVDLLRRLLARRASEAPVVLAIEDLHRVDEVSLDVLARVTDGIGERAILVLALTRAESGATATPWSHSPDYRHLALAPLSEEAQRRLLARWLGTGPASVPVALEPLLTRTGGNPLFLEESVRALREQGRLTLVEGRWRLEGASEPAGAPETLMRVMLARFDRLPGEVRRVLDAAAVAGDPVEPVRLSAIVGQGVLDALRELEERGFLRARWESGTYRFHHDLVRETAVAALEPVRRRALHRRVARTLESAVEDGPAQQAMDADLLERLARHWRIALAAPESGAPVEGADARDVARALQHLVAAGKLALRRLAARAALRHFDAASRLLAAGPPAGVDEAEARALALEARVGAGEAHDRLAEFDAAIEAYELAIRCLAHPTGAQRARAADLARRLGRLHAWGGRYDEALQWLDHGQGQLAERLRDEDRGVAAQLHVQRGVVHYWRGQMDEALAHVQRGLGIAEGTGHREALATGYNVLGAVSDARGERAAAEDAYERSLMLWRALGDDYQAARVADNLGVTYFHRGRWADAAAAHERALAFLDRIEDRDQAAYARINLGNVALGRGLWDEAETLLCAAETDARAVGNHRIEALACLNRGLVALERPDEVQAGRLLAVAAATIEAHDLEDMAAELRLAQGRLALRAGDGAAAEEHARLALDLARTHALRLEEALARRLLGRALSQRASVEEALGHVRWSRGALESLEHGHELGRTLVVLAEVLRLLDDEEAELEARAVLGEARSIFDSLGATADRAALPR